MNWRKAEVEASAESLAEDAASVTAATRCSQTWAMLIKRVYEVDPLCCPECGGEMKVVSFIVEQLLGDLGGDGANVVIADGDLARVRHPTN